MQVVSGLYWLLVCCSVFLGKSRTGDMGKENTSAAKGLLAFSIILCHLTSRTSFHLPGFSFSAMGLIGVGGFFFLSGFGLVQAAKHKGYFDGFLLSHSEKILIPYIMMLVIWLAVFQVILHEGMASFVNSFIGGNPVSNSWYIFASLFCYGLFWLAFKHKRQYSFLGILFGLLIWLLLTGRVLHWPGWWNRTIWGFLIGVIWGLHYGKIGRAIRSHRFLFLLGAIILLVAAYLCPSILSRLHLGESVWLINDVSMGIGGAIFLGVVPECFNLRNPVTDYLGKISYELYLYHGLLIKLFENLLRGVFKVNPEPYRK